MQLAAVVHPSSHPQMDWIVATRGNQRTGNRNAYGCWPDHEEAGQYHCSKHIDLPLVLWTVR